MRFDKSALLLYAVTDRTWLHGQSLCSAVEESLRGGVSFVQLREKDPTQENLLQDALALQALCRNFNCPFVINDHVELALQVDADGVHVGQEDRSASELRTILGPDKILGVSVQSVAQALRAQQDGADYLGVGAVFATGSKLDAAEVSLDTLRDICASVSIPVVAIGGIGLPEIPMLRDSGIAGVSIIRAIFAQNDIQSATKALRQSCLEVFTHETGVHI